jgi:hypothetical protein
MDEQSQRRRRPAMADNWGRMLGPLPPGGPQREPIYRMISLLMIMDLVIGLALIVYGLAVADAPAIAWAGLGLAGIGALLFVFFRALAARAGRRP